MAIWPADLPSDRGDDRQPVGADGDVAVAGLRAGGPQRRDGLLVELAEVAHRQADGVGVGQADEGPLSGAKVGGQVVEAAGEEPMSWMAGIGSRPGLGEGEVGVELGVLLEGDEREVELRERTLEGTTLTIARSSSLPASGRRSAPQMLSQAASAAERSWRCHRARSIKGIDHLGPEFGAGRVAPGGGRGVAEHGLAEVGPGPPDLDHPVPAADELVVDLELRRRDLGQVLELLGHQAGVEHPLLVGHPRPGDRAGLLEPLAGLAERLAACPSCRGSTGIWSRRPG